MEFFLFVYWDFTQGLSEPLKNDLNIESYLWGDIVFHIGGHSGFVSYQSQLFEDWLLHWKQLHC